MVTLVFLAPFSGLVLFYSRILCKIQQITKELSVSERTHHHTLKDVVVMVMTVLLTTMICWLPITIFWFFKYLPKEWTDQRPSLFQHNNVEKPFVYSDEFKYIGETCIFLHCAIQPILYIGFSTRLKRELRSWIRWPKHKVVIVDIFNEMTMQCFRFQQLQEFLALKLLIQKQLTLSTSGPEMQPQTKM